ncbi:flagellar motor switch phosphatase FliY [Sporosarcina gallistercoris]|uniref:Flagellar motor switch phosphatase FliY n=1 Tax=Sporosarcina gallistercoris TaxID=2762245 RepID=A0ABR8PG20_9BACL|nr:flagellar motor switch phosphatase FliY [Sporosarcina gallistercoris]MBD7907121.1 flagellar motor switch phosphatase FliY [Sporosarcina gallistercoris]
MSDNILSQEEIEALLRGESIDTGAEAEQEIQGISTDDYLDEMEQDALGEIGNISFGSSATALSGLLGQKVEITTPKISVINRNELETEFVHPYVAVGVEYTVGLSGTNLLVIKQSDAAIIADLMLGGDGLSPDPDLGEIHLSAVQEAMNQMMGSAATSMSTVFNKKVDISPPTIELLNVQEDKGTGSIPQEDLLIRVSFNLKVGTLIDSNIMQLFPLGLGKELVSSLVGDTAAETAPTVAEPAPQQEQRQEVQQQPPAQPYPQGEQQYSGYSEPQHLPPRQQQNQHANVQQAQFASFESPSLNQSETSNLNLLLDIPLKVTVELGRTKRSVKEILEMSSGSIIELDKLAGEPVDILVNNRHIAKGEVVVIDENFGVRITDILSQTERLNNLR